MKGNKLIADGRTISYGSVQKAVLKNIVLVYGDVRVSVREGVGRTNGDINDTREVLRVFHVVNVSEVVTRQVRP